MTAWRREISTLNNDSDGRFECALAHIHDIYGYEGELTYEGAPCPNDPESPKRLP